MHSHQKNRPREKIISDHEAFVARQRLLRQQILVPSSLCHRRLWLFSPLESRAADWSPNNTAPNKHHHATKTLLHLRSPWSLRRGKYCNVIRSQRHVMSCSRSTSSATGPRTNIGLLLSLARHHSFSAQLSQGRIGLAACLAMG